MKRVEEKRRLQELNAQLQHANDHASSPEDRENVRLPGQEPFSDIATSEGEDGVSKSVNGAVQ